MVGNEHASKLVSRFGAKPLHRGGHAPPPLKKYFLVICVHLFRSSEVPLIDMFAY